MGRVLILLVTLGTITVTVRSSGALVGTPKYRGDAPFSLPFGHHRAEHQNHSAIVDSSLTLKLAVDGAADPDAISYEQAYGHFLAAIASLGKSRGREAALSKTGLTTNDRNAVISGLDSLDAELRTLNDERTAGGNFESLRQRRRLALVSAGDRVRAELSPRGNEMLHDYVETHVKPHIKVYRGGSHVATSEVSK